MPSGPKKRRAAKKKKKELEAKINTNNEETSPTIGAISSGPIDDDSGNKVGDEFSELGSKENAIKSLPLMDEILSMSINEIEMVSEDNVKENDSGLFEEHIYVVDSVDKSEENAAALLEEVVNVIESESSIEAHEYEKLENEETGFNEFVVLEDDKVAQDVLKENNKSVSLEFNDEKEAEKSEEFGTVDQTLGDVDVLLKKKYFGCPLHCNLDCSFYQILNSNCEGEKSASVEQIERFKKNVEAELQVADKMTMFLQKVLHDINAIQKSQG